MTQITQCCEGAVVAEVGLGDTPVKAGSLPALCRRRCVQKLLKPRRSKLGGMRGSVLCYGFVPWRSPC